MIIEASAPSNIALIKYMGKISGQGNRPTNSSLSWTLEGLRTHVRLSVQAEFKQDHWAPLKAEGLSPIDLSQKSQERYLRHLGNLKSFWGIKENFLVESANNFPADCGLASSASSFAALTKASVEMFQQISRKPGFSIQEMADLSRTGSGSSCRSFYGPWALWFSDGVRPLEFQFNNLLHQVVVVEASKKEVSSSEAHLRVGSSSLFQGRPERAEKRLAMLMHALRFGEWQQAFEITWAEFWDMHALFETSEPHFSYMQPESLVVLRGLEKMWQDEKDGPLVTMDAGANIHLLWRPDQIKKAQQVTQELKSRYSVFSAKELNP